MPRFERSFVARVQVWINTRRKALVKLFSPKWLKGTTRTIRVAFNRLLKFVGQTLAPKWLRNTGTTVQKGLRKAEVTVTKTSAQVSKTVSKSTVGTKAKSLARGGKVLENRFGKFLVEGTKFVLLLLSVLIPSPVRRFFRAIGRAFWRVFGVFFVFLGRWFRTRRYWNLVGGVPAFLMALPLAYCMVRLPFYDTAKKARHYQIAAQQALDDNSFDEANLYYRKLTQLGAMNEIAEYQSAVNAYLSGEKQAAFDQMSRLATTATPGLPAAHVWIARWFLNREYLDEKLLGDRTPPSPDEVQRIITLHLDLAVQRDPGFAPATAARAMLLSQQGQYEAAIEQLKSVVRQMPGERVRLAYIYAARGDWQAAQKELTEIREAYEERIERGETLEPYDAIAFASIFVLTGDTDRAQEILEVAFEAHPQNDDLRNALYKQLWRNANAAFATDQGNPSAIVDRFLRAWQLKPEEEAPLIRLGDISRRQTAMGQYVRQEITTLMQAEDPPKLLFSIVGGIAANDQDWPEAILHLTKSVQLDPTDHFSFNNLAFALMMRGSDLDEALKMVERALELDPGQAMYVETRGQILLKLNRYEEAIKDLSYALNGLGDLPEVHASLASAYDRLGDSRQAEVHRQRANQ